MCVLIRFLKLSYIYFTYKLGTCFLKKIKYGFIKFGSSVLRIKDWIGIFFESQVDIKITEDQNKLQNPPFKSGLIEIRYLHITDML